MVLLVSGLDHACVSGHQCLPAAQDPDPNAVDNDTATGDAFRQGRQYDKLVWNQFVCWE